MSLLRIALPRNRRKSISPAHYDAIVVGSGAAGGHGGARAHQPRAEGAAARGRPQARHRGRAASRWSGRTTIRAAATCRPARTGSPSNEYTIRKPPYAQGLPHKHVYSYVQSWNGTDYSKNIVVDEKDHPYTGTNYAWVRARCLGGKTNIWGRLALRLSDYDFKAKSHDGYGEDWPICVRRHRAVLRQGRSVPRHLGREGEPAAPARQHLPAPDPADAGRGEDARRRWRRWDAC